MIEGVGEKGREDGVRGGGELSEDGDDDDNDD